MRTIFDVYQEEEGRILLATLLSCGYIERAEHEEEYFTVPTKKPGFLEFYKTEIMSVRTSIRAHYRQHSKEFDELVIRFAT